MSVAGRRPVKMPHASAQQFVDDMRGKLDHKAGSGHSAIDGVIKGKGKFLGRGNDGAVYRHGDKVVKHSTTMPYQPENAGHRTPQGAIEHLRQEHDAHEELKGLKHVQDVEGQEHDGRYWMVKPHLDPIGKMTRGELDSVGKTLQAMHERGLVMNDEIQLGRDKGTPMFMDLGQVTKAPEGPKGTALISDDLRRLDDLYRANGESRTPAGAELRKKEKVARSMLQAAVKKGDAARLPARLARWTTLTDAIGLELLDDEDNDPELDAWSAWWDEVAPIAKAAEAAMAPMSKAVALSDAVAQVTIEGAGTNGEGRMSGCTDGYGGVFRILIKSQMPLFPAAGTGKGGKAHVKAHTRTTPGGKRVPVVAHERTVEMRRHAATRGLAAEEREHGFGVRLMRGRSRPAKSSVAQQAREVMQHLTLDVDEMDDYLAQLKRSHKGGTPETRKFYRRRLKDEKQRRIDKDHAGAVKTHREAVRLGYERKYEQWRKDGKRVENAEVMRAIVRNRAALKYTGATRRLWRKLERAVSAMESRVDAYESGPSGSITAGQRKILFAVRDLDDEVHSHWGTFGPDLHAFTLRIEACRAKLRREFEWGNARIKHRAENGAPVDRRKGVQFVSGVGYVNMDKAVRIGVPDGYGHELLVYAPQRLVDRVGGLQPMRKAVAGALTPGVGTGASKRLQFQCGRYICDFMRSAVGLGILTISGGGLPLPFHMVCRTFRKAKTLAAEATAAFEAGELPGDGLFRATDLAPMKYPGATA